MTWRYSQGSGELSRDGIFLCRGYAGNGPGKNNGAMETVPNIGPLPKGKYRIVAIQDTPEHGPRVLRLTQVEGATYGRSGFLIHGDSIERPGEASKGCIICGRIYRELIWGTKDNLLEVVA